MSDNITPVGIELHQKARELELVYANGDPR